jgi:threonine dehydrogenase-like Zn-dependent dehydrogenase
VVTHRMSFDDVIRAYEIFDKRLEGAIKILLTT